MSVRLWVFVGITVALAAVLLLTHAPDSFSTPWWHLLAWAGIAFLSDTMWSATPAGTSTWSLSACACLSAVAIFGTGPGLWIALASTFAADRFVLRKPMIRAVFNATQITFSAWCAGLAFDVLGGRGAMLSGQPAALPLVVPFLGLILAYFISNRAMVACAVAWSSTGRSWWSTLRSCPVDTSPIDRCYASNAENS